MKDYQYKIVLVFFIIGLIIILGMGIAFNIMPADSANAIILVTSIALIIYAIGGVVVAIITQIIRLFFLRQSIKLSFKEYIHRVYDILPWNEHYILFADCLDNGILVMNFKMEEKLWEFRILMA